MSEADRAALEAWLKAGAGGGEPARRIHETPIAKVYVFADRVLKLKKPVDFGFLDFTTREKRAWAVRRELAFNRTAAADVYRAVHAVVERPGGFALSPADTPQGEPVEHVLEMAPFESERILANHPDQVDGALAERLGREVARVQAAGPVAPADQGLAGLDYVLTSNAHQLRSLTSVFDAPAVEALLERTRSAFDSAASLLQSRGAAGFVRRCHGDLHLGNIVQREDGSPLLFDCIEFNDTLSQIDVGYDIAFLLMDLSHRGRAEAANRVLNAWLDACGREAGAERLAVTSLLPLFQSVRAAVRAHVTAHSGDGDAASRYLDAALSHLQPAPAPELRAVGGLSGSGKSTFARRLAPTLGSAPGAVVLRSDEIRKRLFDVDPLERLGPQAYRPEVSPKVYDRMLEEARAVLSVGGSVVLDAAFLRAEERQAATALAQEMRVPFIGVWMEAAPEVLRARVSARTGDASDANEAVLERQLQLDLGPINWARTAV